MLKLIKHLKPYTRTIIIIFVLLLGAAMADLTLPDLMSKIINIGVQQNGIENVAPEVIRASEMNRILMFVSSDDKTTVINDYILLDKSTLAANDYNRYVISYPELANITIYKLNTTNKKEISKLNSIFANPTLVVSYIESGELASAGFNGITIPTGVDPFVFLSQLPAEQLTTIRQAAQTQISALPKNVINQYDMGYLAAEYKTIGVNVNHMQTSYIIKIGGLMLLLTLGSVSASILVGFLAARVAASYGRDIRRAIFTRVESYSDKEFDKFSTASLITRSTNDITQIQLVLVMMLRIIFYAPILAVGGIIKALGQDVYMSWIIAAAVMALLIMMGIVFAVAIPKFKKIQNQIDRLNLVTREMLTGLMVVRAFNSQKYEENKFENANVDLTNTMLYINRIMVFMMPVMMLLMNVVMIVIVWVGAHRIDLGEMQVGNMMAFMQYAIQIIIAFLLVSIVFIMIPRAAVSAERIDEVLETETSIKDPKEPEKYKGDVKGLVEFQNVGFKYPGAEDYVLQGITFTARPGQTTAIVGGTGSGKSTLVNLIPRFYDVTEGKILVNNIDIRNIAQHDLREIIGYIPQKASLFSGTIESNIAYGNDNSQDGEVKKAAEIAQLMDYIEATEKGFQTPIAQGASNISGGQKQRVSIARALARKPEIYLFDDSFSAVDFKTDAALRKALKKETGDSAVLIVAQRISTVMQADQIIVLEDGRIVGKGTHKELMNNCQVYQELAMSQLSREELS